MSVYKYEKIYNCNGIGTIDIGMSIKRRKKKNQNQVK